MRRDAYMLHRYSWGELWGGYERIWPSGREGHGPLLGLKQRFIPREGRP